MDKGLRNRLVTKRISNAPARFSSAYRIITASFFLLLMAGCDVRGFFMDRSEWYPTFSTPKPFNTTMIVLDGAFTLVDDTVLPLHVGHGPGGIWGQGSGLRVEGPREKALPQHLSISWVSTVERKRYTAECPLPVEEMRQDNEKGSRLSNTESLSIGGEYSRFIIGIAPQGMIRVWASGLATKIAVATCQGKEVDIPFEGSAMSEGGGYSSWDELYAASMRYDFPDGVEPALALVESNPWRNVYTKRFPYTVVLDGFESDYLANIFTLGGERLTFGDIRSIAQRFKTYEYPQDVSLSVPLGVEPRPRSYRVIFDETEVIAAFDRLSAPDPDAPLTLTFEQGPNGGIAVSLANETEVYIFRNFTLER